MVRRALTALVMAAVPLLIGVSAWAGTTVPYPAPSVSSGGIQVLPTSQVVAAPSSGAATAPDLAYTGVSVNVVPTVLVAAAVLLVGVALVVLGARRLRGTRRL